MVQSEKAGQETEDLFAPAAAPRWIAGILGVLVLGIVGAWFAGVLDPLTDYVSPTKVEVTGIATFNGKPLPRGLVQSFPEVNGRMGSLGEIRSDGTFTLTTNGDPGVFSGVHRFAVSYMTTSFPPSSLIPEEYASVKLTPFKFTVQRGQANRFKLEMKGEMKGEKPSGPAQSEPEPNLAPSIESDKSE